MEMIKNYLDQMFLSLPGTPEVLQAKQELLQMMEDRYRDLIEEGRSENEAVGTVIAEFGNLEELAEELGIESVVSGRGPAPEARVTVEEAQRFVRAHHKSGILRGIGVFCLMVCELPVALTALADTYKNGGTGNGIAAGVALLFILIAAGIGLLIWSAMALSEWKWVRNGQAVIDYGAVEYAEDGQKRFRPVYIVCVVVGVILCIVSALPVSSLGAYYTFYEGDTNVFRLASSGLLAQVFIAAAIFLFIWANARKNSYQRLVNLGYMQRPYSARGRDEKEVFYENPILRNVMEFYWPTVLALYLIWSFLTFHWGLTWLIWPIAGIVNGIIERNYGIRKNE